VHYADLDGDGHPDRIWFTAGAGFHFTSNGLPAGRWTLHATLSSTGQTASRTFRVNGYGWPSRRRWTPWVGATDLDHTGGQEIVLGAEGAGDAALYRAVVYWDGALRILPSPGTPPNTPDWVIVGAYFHGGGFRCTQHGVAFLSYGAANRRATRWRVERSDYVWLDDAWQLVHTTTRYLHSRAGHAPRGVVRYGGFSCEGLHFPS
jgi:hypothetical protein